YAGNRGHHRCGGHRNAQARQSWQASQTATTNHPTQKVRRRQHIGGELLHRRAQLGLNVAQEGVDAHRGLLTTSTGASSPSATTARRRSSPRDAWLLTVPTEQPRASAISASVMSSK